MDSIRQYILSVIAAALICSIANRLITAKGAYAAVVKLIGGLFLTITIIAPLTNIQFSDPESYFSDLSLEAEAITHSGQLAAEKVYAEQVKMNVESLILDKAAELDTQINASVILEEKSAIPQKVRITGAISPYSKEILSQYIQDSLGIAKEDQIWM